jgi:hypothetical protein
VSRPLLRLDLSRLNFNKLSRGKKLHATKPGRGFGLLPRWDRTTMLQLTRKMVSLCGNVVVWAAYQAAVCLIVGQLHGWVAVGVDGARGWHGRA